MVANNFGELYGVELLTGVTYRIDKETGECVALGNSGISPKYMQSACIDPQTNVIYWLATLSGNCSALTRHPPLPLVFYTFTRPLKAGLADFLALWFALPPLLRLWLSHILKI